MIGLGASTSHGASIQAGLRSVHLAATFAAHTRAMSMSDPLLPVTPDRSNGDQTVAAEPGAGGPEPEHAEAPDRPDDIQGDPDEGSLDDALGDEPAFRRPVPGNRLSPDELAEEG